MKKGTIDILAVYELPASLIFAESCLEKSAPARIAGMDGEIRLPSIKWTADDRPCVTAPLFDDLPPKATQLLLEDDSHQKNA